MKKEKNIKATYRKPTVEVYPLLEECPILAGTNTAGAGTGVNTGTTIQPYVKDTTNIDIGGKGTCDFVCTTDDGEFTCTQICH